MSENEEKKTTENIEISGATELLNENWQQGKKDPEEAPSPEGIEPEGAAAPEGMSSGKALPSESTDPQETMSSESTDPWEALPPESTDPWETLPLEDMDPAEAAIVAKALARLMVKAENASGAAADTDFGSEDSGAAQGPASTDTAAGDAATSDSDVPDALPAGAIATDGTAAPDALPEDAIAADDPGAAQKGSPEDKPVEPPTLQHVLTEEELLAAEAAEQAAKKTFKGKSKSAFRRLISVATPDNKKLAIPAVIAELLALAALLIILGRYSHVAPPTPTEYADDRRTDVIKCLDGELIVNGVTAKVPSEGNVSYSISYVWAEDDTDYPSVPHAIIASYKEDAAPAASEKQEQDTDAASEKAEDQGGDKVVSSEELGKDAKSSSGKESSEDADSSSKDENSEEAADKDTGEEASDSKADEESSLGSDADDSDSKADEESSKSSGADSKADTSKDNASDGKASDASKDAASDDNASDDGAPAEDANTLYEISLYKDSFTAEKDIPKGKDASNWFSDWTEEKSDDAYKFAHRVGKTYGFCISTLNSKTAPEDYRTYTYYFAVPENNGIALYVLEGTCYDPESRKDFTTIIKNAINSIEVNIEET